MPLVEGYSKKSMAKNIASEEHAGKEPRQAIAIAYAKARDAKRRAKMWEGGLVDDDMEDLYNFEHTDTSGSHDRQGQKEDDEVVKLAMGGKVPMPADPKSVDYREFASEKVPSPDPNKPLPYDMRDEDKRESPADDKQAGPVERQVPDEVSDDDKIKMLMKRKAMDERRKAIEKALMALKSRKG